MSLSPKQQRFVAEYLIDLNGKQAAIRSGYAPKNAEIQASRLLRSGKVADAVAAAKAKQLDTAELTAARVLEEYRRIAFADIRGYFDAAGNLKPIHQLTEEQGSALAGLEVIIKNAKAGDGVTDEVHKFKLWDKTRALESLAKHFGLLTEKVEHMGTLEIAWRDSE